MPEMAIERAGLDALFGALRRRGYTLVGPTVRDGAIVYDEIESAADLPAGWTDEQDGGTYRLAAPRRRGAVRLRRRARTPGSSYLLPADAAPLAGAARRGRRASRSSEEPTSRPRYAFIGVRSCDLHAIAIQDRVFIERRLRRPRLRGAPRATRSSSRSTAARPAAPASASRWRPGPTATSGFDLALTEVLDDGGHRFLVEVGQRARRRGARRAAAPRPASEATRPRRPRSSSERAAPDGPRAGHRRDQGAALPQLRAPALGRGRRALPDLRQLHDGLPDLLLHHGRGRHRPRRRGGRARARSGTPASRSTSPTSTAAASALGALALPPVDDPQARDLDRPVRHLGLRRLRALHHLVPGGDRHHRGGGGDPRRRTGATGRRPMQTIDELLAEVAGASPGLGREHLELIAGCAPNRGLRRRRVPVPRGRAGGHAST